MGAVIKLIYNKIRLFIIWIFKHPVLKLHGIQLLGYNTKMVFHPSSYIELGDRVISDGRCVFIVDKDASLKIGNHVYFNEGMMISCKSSIQIGDGCQFGPNVKIFDNNHCYNASQGVLGKHTTNPIRIGENCWIASNVIILKGTVIGDNCVIGAGCVIKENIPNSSIVTQVDNLKVKQIQERN